MQSERKVKQIVEGTAQQDGAGVNLLRVLGRPNVKDFDPFLMLDAFDSTNPEDYIKGFPWHPHRGIETVTYLIEGDVQHGDSLGNRGNIEGGCCQWMSAGSGIIHQEMPQVTSRMLGAQLWINLPKKDKMMDPTYRDIQKSDIPEVADENAIVQILSGGYAGFKGPLAGGAIDTLYLDVQVKPGASWSIETDDKATLFVYLISGLADFDGKGEFVPAKRAVLLTLGTTFNAKASKDGARFLLLSARPLGEPIAWGGPIVMNTHQELMHAFKELDDATFIKHKKSETHLDEFMRDK